MEKHCESHEGLSERITALGNVINTWGKALCVVIPLCAGVTTFAFAYIGIPALTQSADLKARIAEEFAKRDLVDKGFESKINEHSDKISKLEEKVFKK